MLFSVHPLALRTPVLMMALGDVKYDRANSDRDALITKGCTWIALGTEQLLEGVIQLLLVLGESLLLYVNVSNMPRDIRLP